MFAQDAQSENDTPNAVQIQSAIENLGSRDFEERESARDKLWHMGEAARTALEVAAESENLEVSLRAKKLLEQLELGIRPDTTSEQVSLIKKFLKGSKTEQVSSVNILLQQMQVDLVLRLIKAEKRKSQRNQITLHVADKSQKLATKLIDGIQFGTAGEVLRLGIGTAKDIEGRMTQQYAVFLKLQNQLGERIESLQNEFQKFDQSSEDKSA
ncbi:MAG: hypothetical protein AB8B55_20880 [Mariniblastus sp.]